MASPPVRGLHLAGGNYAGVGFHAGLVQARALQGDTWDVLAGVSAGAIVAAALASQLGAGASWPAAADWVVAQLATIRSPGQVVRERIGPLGLGWLAGRLGWTGGAEAGRLASLALDVVRGRTDVGLVTLEPLRAWLAAHLDPVAIARVPVSVGAVELESGEIVYTRGDDPDFLAWVLASASVPGATPPVRIRGRHYQDGGVRDIAPTIDAGADHVTVVDVAPAAVGTWTGRRTLPGVLGRTMGIVTHETRLTDVKLAVARTLAGPPWRPVGIALYQGTRRWPGVDMRAFSTGDRLALLAHGAEIAAAGPAVLA